MVKRAHWNFLNPSQDVKLINLLFLFYEDEREFERGGEWNKPAGGHPS
jgi:hypothetical protein